MKCEFCVFESEPGNMRRHVKAVHKVIEYECSKCSKKFKRSSTLEKNIFKYVDQRSQKHMNAPNVRRHSQERASGKSILHSENPNCGKKLLEGVLAWNSYIIADIK